MEKEEECLSRRHGGREVRRKNCKGLGNRKLSGFGLVGFCFPQQSALACGSA